jgi:hypothetical protein
MEYDLSKYFPQGRQRIKQTERQPRIVVDWKQIIIYTIQLVSGVRK